METTTYLGDYRTWDTATGARRYVGVIDHTGDVLAVGVIDLANPRRAYLIGSGDPTNRTPVTWAGHETPTVSEATAAIMYDHAHQ